ncbi:serine hydrolase [Streptococcus pacificus]|uniref:D-alanyl-D-alanine carboxypeptidase n=1 Tax=Streptococcus pacificus TaxID=2740577 RepID=A0ABS0ZGJ3_9STRE|nr:D-alanyl-D-alanine carboxypeptidase [Streptococcus pacificus]
MKKFFQLITLLTLLFSTTVSIFADETTEDLVTLTRQAGYEVDEINKPKASITMDADTGEILWAENADVQRDPASMSKMMTLYLLFEELEKGNLTLDSTIVATETDQAISQIYEISNNNIVAGVAYPIRDLITMTVVPSSNVATVMIANYLSQNNASDFIDKMNAKAKELGMTNTQFNNASGAVASSFNGYYSPERYDNNATNLTTVRDFATLAYHFLKKFPEIVNYTNQTTVTVMAGTPYEDQFTSYNHSLPGGAYPFEGVDGLKTGSSPSAGFNAMTTAKQGDKRLIVVVMGVGDWSDQNGEFYRHPFINTLFQMGFIEAQKRQEMAAQTTEEVTEDIQVDQANTSYEQSFMTRLLPVFLIVGTAIVSLIALLVFLLLKKRNKRRIR